MRQQDNNSKGPPNAQTFKKKEPVDQFCRDMGDPNSLTMKGCPRTNTIKSTRLTAKATTADNLYTIIKISQKSETV